MYKTAILVDGDFFLRAFQRKVDPNRTLSPERLANLMWKYWVRHVDRKHGEQLYRIFFYDCPPLTTRIHHPTTNELIDHAKTPIAQFRSELHKQLVKQPFVANRLGFLDEKNARWTIRNADKHKRLLKGTLQASDIAPSEIRLHASQKGVDMKIGLDIATLVLKNHVDRIVLISGDSDFVPAAKLARSEGAHFVLDAMQQRIRNDLSEHIDGLKSFINQFAEKHAVHQEP